jgi:hypothetical protein
MIGLKKSGVKKNFALQVIYPPTPGILTIGEGVVGFS